MTDVNSERQTEAEPFTSSGDDTYILGPEVSGTAEFAPTGAISTGRQRTMWADVWRELRHNIVFWIGAVIVTVMVLIALFPAFFSFGRNPRDCDLANSAVGPTAG